MGRIKTKRFEFRVSDILYNKFLCICKTSNKNLTQMFEEMIQAEYGKNAKYWECYMSLFGKKP